MNICQVCKKEYVPTRHPQYFCSRNCFYKSIAGHKSYVPKATIVKNCEVCKKEFQTGGRLGKKEQRYCSLECLYRSNYKSEITPNELSSVEKAYLAGIMDGEGSISLLKKTSRNPRVRIQVANTDKSLMNWLVSKTGVGNINHKNGNDKHKVGYLWVCNNEPAIAILNQIKDYLIIKKERCELALEASYILNKHNNMSDITNSMALIYEKMKELNKRGPN